MAKAKTSSTATKVTFGKRRLGVSKKSYNKHSPRPKKYRGQGR